MRRLFFFVGFFFTFFGLASSSQVQAQETASRSGESIFISEKSITLSEEYSQTVFVTGGQVVFNGHARGDLVVLGGSVRIQGQVDQDVYAAGGSVFIDGSVGGNVVATGSELRLHRLSRVQGDVITASSRLITEGTVLGSVRSYARQANLGGSISGNLKLSADVLNEAPSLEVGGTKELHISKQEPKTAPTSVERLNAFAQHFLLETLWRGVLLIFVFWFAHEGLKKGSLLLQHRPVAVFFDGMMVLVFGAIASLIFLITLFGAPLFFIGVFGLVAASLTGWVFIIPWLGKKLAPAQALWLQYTLALGVLSFVVALPFLGLLIQVIFVAWGVGVWWKLLTHKHA